MSVIDLRKDVINLSKTAALSLEKNNISDIKVNLLLVTDVSTSMDDLYLRNYQNGVSKMGIFLTRILGLAKNFNDNAQISYYSFGSNCSKLKTLNIDNINEKTAQNIYNEYSGMRGTSFLSFFNEFIDSKFIKKDVVNIQTQVFKEYNWFIKLLIKFKIISAIPTFKTEKNIKLKYDDKLPLYILFLTDGETDPSEEDKIKNIIKELSSQKIFIQFLSIGKKNKFLEDLNKLYDNGEISRDSVGYYDTKSPVEDSDEKLYDELLKDFSRWINTF